MSNTFTTSLNLPAQAAAETEATILKWHISEGDVFEQGQLLAEAESAKSTFEFEAPCDGKVSRLLFNEGETASFEEPVIEIETSDESVKKFQTAEAARPPVEQEQAPIPVSHTSSSVPVQEICIKGIGGYLPKRVVDNKELLEHFDDISDEYVYGVTGIRERRWGAPDEKPSDMALAAANEALKKANLGPDDVGGIIVATTTPDYAMPSTACVLQQKLAISKAVPSFDLNAACSGWLYGISVAKGLIASGVADNLLVVAVDIQSRLLEPGDRATYFLFGDGAGAAVIASGKNGHRVGEQILAADAKGINQACRLFPGYEVPANCTDADPWIRLDGRALFRFATESFSFIIRQVIEKSGWQPRDVRWVVPHQANGRILKAAAKKSGVPFDRFFLNIDHVGNTSAASIPLALIEIEKYLSKGDKLVFCSVGAGITYAALAVEW
ncbi:MAG: beta-ketoacyl-ACP synthase III [Chitinivibrionales bacterium]|nr:beta-ketoacyl-ACP synthase III [Chitinivibrionales bacterium]